MWKEYFIVAMSKTLTTQTTGNLVDSIVTRIDSDADFEFQKTHYYSIQEGINIRYRDDSVGRYLLKDPIDLKMVAGTSPFVFSAFLPYVWPRPYVISAGASFTVELGDYTGVPNTVYLAFHGAKIRPGQAPWDRRFRALVPFTYSFPGGNATIAANSSATITINIDNDSHFIVQKIVGKRSADGLLVSVNEGARGRDWSNAPVHIDNFIGGAEFPNILGANRFIYKGSAVTFNFQEIKGYSTTVNIGLAGVKCYE